MKFVFTGKPDKRFPLLVTGEVYNVKFGKMSIIDMFLNGIEVLITEPVYCPYVSVKTFLQNWEKVKV